MSAVMDDLRMDSVNIDNFNLIVKLANQRVLRMLPRGSEGVILVVEVQLMMIRWLQNDDQ